MKRHSSFPRRIVAFSLVEVVLALGLISFALIAMIGLLSTSLKTGKESAEYTQAGNLASALLLSWRATTNTATYPALPPLTNVSSVVSNTTPIVMGIQGTTVTSGLPVSDTYNLRYRISPGCSPHLLNVYLILWWPVQSANPAPGEYYESTTEFATP